MYRKEILIYLLSVLFIASAALLHILYERQALPFTVITLVFFLYAMAILLWARNMENRILSASVAKRFKVIAFLLIGYLGTRTLKYQVLIQSPAAGARVRYAYYFFILSIVHMVFLTSLNVGRSERDPIDERWNLLWVPTGLLIFFHCNQRLPRFRFCAERPNHGLRSIRADLYPYLGLHSLSRRPDPGLYVDTIPG